MLDLSVNMMVANVDDERILPSNLKVPEYALRLLGFSEAIYLRWTPP